MPDPTPLAPAPERDPRRAADHRYVPAGSRATADPSLSEGQERVLLTLLDEGRGLPIDTITVAGRFVHAGDADALIRLGYAEAIGRLVRLTGSGCELAIRVHADYYDLDD